MKAHHSKLYLSHEVSYYHQPSRHKILCQEKLFNSYKIFQILQYRAHINVQLLEMAHVTKIPAQSHAFCLRQTFQLRQFR